jgi:dCTP diphosphatase
MVGSLEHCAAHNRRTMSRAWKVERVSGKLDGVDQGARWPAVVQHQLRAFAEDRDWTKFHSPRNLILALVGEVGELAELYQWDTAQTPSPERVAEEVADILIYLLRLADVVGVDVVSAVAAKLAANELKYPASEWRGRAGRAADERGAHH